MITMLSFLRLGATAMERAPSPAAETPSDRTASARNNDTALNSPVAVDVTPHEVSPHLAAALNAALSGSEDPDPKKRAKMDKKAKKEAEKQQKEAEKQQKVSAIHSFGHACSPSFIRLV